MEDQNVIKSPLTHSNRVVKVKKINLTKVIGAYSRFDIDVSRYFGENKSLELYECEDSKYQFYLPFNAAGDSAFYEHFQQYDWYYMPWKWEHMETMNLVEEDQRILEVGCGEGAFLKRVYEEKNVNGIGLELNENTALSNQEGWQILNTTIEDYSKSHEGEFDLVCSFQVLEHIVDVRSFLEAKVRCLKPGGKLVICVPNNDSYIRHYFNCLNTPPHHMGLWNEQSLTNLTKLLGLSSVDIKKEPLQVHQVPGYVAANVHALLPGKAGELVVKIMRKIGVGALREKQVRKNADKILGHSIMAIYTKSID